MSEDRHVLREIAWQEVFPSVLLFSVWRVAINLRALCFASLGIFVTWLGWLAIDKAVDMPAKDSVGGEWWAPVVLLPTNGWEWWNYSPIAQAWADLTRPFAVAFAPDISGGRVFYLLACGLWALVVWAFAGGAITRLAAVQLAREEKLSWGQLISYARTKWPSYFAAPLYPIVGALVATIPLAILGLLIRTGGFGVVVVAVLWPVVLCAGIVMAILLLGLFLNWPLMWPTISSEGTDSFDALSRSYAYSFQRPLRYAGYLFVLAAIGVLAWLLVVAFGGEVLRLSEWAVKWGSGRRLDTILLDRESLGGASRFGANLIYLWNRVVHLLMMGFAFSYFFSGATAVYLLLRYHIDATETDEVYLPDEAEAYGLPPLKADSAGVVQVADVATTAKTENGSPEG